MIDERFNGGGQAADYIINVMNRPLQGWWSPRYGAIYRTPAAQIFGPKVMIINEFAGSGGDMMPWMFRYTKTGTLVGKRTWGGLVGISQYPTLMDGGNVTAPNFGFFNPEGQWDVENKGVKPDVEVEMDPKLVKEGHDPQLERAVAIALEQMKTQPGAAAQAAAVSQLPAAGGDAFYGGTELNTAIRAPRGAAISCKGWHQEAALRMLHNNLDPEVAEKPDELIVYGGTGRAARDWPSFHAIVRALRSLENDETLLVQSGRPVGIFRTQPESPRVLIANSNLVGHWSNFAEFTRLERLGLTMYGQMTAGSWIYIGSQGIVQGTYETFASLGRKHFGGSLAGKLVVSGGMGGMGGAQPLAATMSGACFLGVDVDRERIERRLSTGYCDRLAGSLDEALAILASREPVSVALVGNCAEVLPELVRRGIVPDVLTDQTSAHDPLNGYVPHGMTLEEARGLRSRNPEEYVTRATGSMGVHVEAMLELQKRGAVTFDYGNNIRTQAKKAGVENAFDIPGFVPEYIRPLFCEGRGPFRWVALSGDPEDIYRTDRLALELFPADETLARWIRWPASACNFRDCRRASAGSATGSGRSSGWP